MMIFMKHQPNLDKGEMLNYQFQKCFNSSLPPLSFSDLDELPVPNDHDIDDILCTVEEVELLLTLLDTSK